ncbi:hypothetical protein PoB_006838400 [Plakobranchus ocellatus]|uniref:Uncharacterized protein n=1 Tax=Plakobranchus ocellatus TaxID=259542 RepID=A0AAV4DCJ4_9GAST|nr:hypothetical protein PoB_006838400 [Plakobranchus ocellatus]
MGNPFMEESEYLLVLDSRDIADPAIVQSVRSIEKTGQDQYDKIDIVWDVYLEDSLKSTTREIQGRGIRRRVAPPNAIPSKWQEFLRLADNKTELFEFLAHQVVENLYGDKDIFTTCGQNVLCSRAPCTYEEADTTMLLQALHSAKGIAELRCVLWTLMFSSLLSRLLFALQILKSRLHLALANI